MTLPTPAPAKLKDRTEFSITLEVPAVPEGTPAGQMWYRYEYKGTGPGNDSSKQTIDAKPDDKEVVLDDLNPTSTYEICIYLVHKGDDGTEQLSSPSEAAAVDTDVPGCTPEPKCVIS